jgi:hypothetical protein
MMSLGTRGGIAVSRRERITKELIVEPGTEANIAGRDPGWTGGPEFEELSARQLSRTAKALLAGGVQELATAQELLLSKPEQKRRFLARLDEPGKQWKFSAADLAERAHWDDYIRAFEEAITATSTPWAPWYVIPADHKPVMQAMVAAILVDTIGSLDLSLPEVSEQARAANAEARRNLAAEPEDAPGGP